jgi:hypothetical protein
MLNSALTTKETDVRDLYVLEALTDNGLTIRTGPTTIASAMATVDEHLIPNNWRHRYLAITPDEQAVRHFTAVRQPHPIVEADFFVALRRVIIADPDRDGLDDHVTLAVLAHVDPHRPMQMWRGDEECLLGECGLGEGGHTRNAEGACEGMERAERLCVACSAIIDSRSEFGPWYSVRVEWPCSVISSAARQYSVSFSVPA